MRRLLAAAVGTESQVHQRSKKEEAEFDATWIEPGEQLPIGGVWPAVVGVELHQRPPAVSVESIGPLWKALV